MINVVVGSTNPVKIKCVQEAFDHMMPELGAVVKGEQSSSGVREQPMGDEETFLGALNRASNAKMKFPDAEFWAGVEGGVGYHDKDMEAFAWIVILSKEGMGKARTSSFMLPEAVKELVESGVELGHANDKIFSTHNSKQGSGAVGILTNDLIDRRKYYQEAAILALIPFKNKGLY